MAISSIRLSPWDLWHILSVMFKMDPHHATRTCFMVVYHWRPLLDVLGSSSQDTGSYVTSYVHTLSSFGNNLFNFCWKLFIKNILKYNYTLKKAKNFWDKICIKKLYMILHEVLCYILKWTTIYIYSSKQIILNIFMWTDAIKEGGFLKTCYN